ncbi:MAG: rhodanese-like domain-containing protein [bacterium]|nr:MAG: rhodanese-like domain-containing protein [bacterium]
MVLPIAGPDLKGKLDRRDDIVIVDARAREDYLIDHIPGAFSLLNMEVEQKAEGLLPRGVPVVVYSNDADCPASGLVAGKLDGMGFGPVFDYNDSYADWKERGYPLESGPPEV